MGFNQVSDDGQADPAPPNAATRVAPEKPLEDMGTFCLGHPWAGIGDYEAGLSALGSHDQQD